MNCDQISPAKKAMDVGRNHFLPAGQPGVASECETTRLQRSGRVLQGYSLRRLPRKQLPHSVVGDVENVGAMVL